MDTENSESLRQQFKLIQEQQQRKLLARKQRKAKNAEKSDESSVKATTEQDKNSNSFSNGFWGMDDGGSLDLKLETSNVPENGSILVDELQEALRVLKDENGRLYKLLGERDEEMRILRKARSEERKALGGTGVAADTAAGRIMELSKKNRDLTADLESERSKVRQLTAKNRDLEKGLVVARRNNADLQAMEPQGSQSPCPSEKDKQETAVLQDKLNQTNNKVAELRNQNEMLKKELKVSHKVLSKEVGEGFNIQSLLSDSNGWRGRQQQITALQNKVAELKGQLQQVARTGSAMSGNFLLRSSVLGPPTVSSQYDEKHRSTLKRIEKDRKEAQEKSQAELEKLVQEHSKLQQKHDAAKARNKVLANELKALKSQIQTLLEKGAHDDELIAALMREQQHLKETAKKMKTESQSPQDNAVTLQLRQICLEREERVKQLGGELGLVKEALQRANEELQSAATNKPETVSVGCNTENLPTEDDSLFKRIVNDEFSSNTSEETRRAPVGYQSEDPRGSISQHKTEPHIQRDQGPLQGQSGGPSLSRNSVPENPSRRNVLPGGGVSHSRRSLSRSSSQGSHRLPPTPPTGERTMSRGRRNSAGSSDEIHLLRAHIQESKSLCQAAQVERDRLLELVSVLQRRLDESNTKTLDATNQLQQQRRQNAQLEKQLGRVQSTHSTAKSKSRGSGINHIAEDSRTSRLGPEEVEQIRTRLSIQMDENIALKEALGSTLKAKEDDLKLYQELVEQTKKVFLQGLRQFRQNSAPS